MEIGTKLKNARTVSGLTQEQVAERLGVSRQTMSNWENDRSYPDIISVIKMSDLYSISLDQLLKEDSAMSYYDYLEESTNTVKAAWKKTKIIQIGIYLIIWALVIIGFYTMSLGDEMGYTILSFYIILPVVTLITGVLIGRDTAWGRSKWLMILFFGIMFALALVVTFGIVSSGAIITYIGEELGALAIGAALGAMGIGIGTALKKVSRKRFVIIVILAAILLYAIPVATISIQGAILNHQAVEQEAEADEPE